MFRHATRFLVCLLASSFVVRRGRGARRDQPGRRRRRSAARGSFAVARALSPAGRKSGGERTGAAAIIFDMDTYGGRLDSAEEITGILNHATIPTYTYINTNAGSAGSLIALSTKHIYMAPVSAIGAAAPILSTGEDLPPTEKEKTVSYWSALIRGAAQRNGHNPDIGEAFMNKEKEVKIGDRVDASQRLASHPQRAGCDRKNQRKTGFGRGHRRVVARSGQNGGIERRGRAVRAERLRATRFLAHCARSSLIVRRNSRRLHRVQDSRLRVGRESSPSSVLRSFFSDTISPGWPAGKWSRFSSSASFSSSSKFCFSGTPPSSSVSSGFC